MARLPRALFAALPSPWRHIARPKASPPTESWPPVVCRWVTGLCDLVRESMMEINGVAHTFITAGDFAKSRAFYRQLLPYLGMREVLDVTGTYYCVGGRTGFGIRQPSPEHAGQRFVQN